MTRIVYDYSISVLPKVDGFVIISLQYRDIPTIYFTFFFPFFIFSVRVCASVCLCKMTATNYPQNVGILAMEMYFPKRVSCKMAIGEEEMRY